MQKKPYWKSEWFIGLVVTLIVLLTSSTDLQRDLEYWGYDLGVRFSPQRQANPDVVVVAIDETALQTLGEWPWPRDILAQVTRTLSASKPAVIGYAFPLANQQSKHRSLKHIQSLQKVFKATGSQSAVAIRRLLWKAEAGLQTDQAFAKSLQQVERVVLAIPYELQVDQGQGNAVKLPDYLRPFALTHVAGRPEPDKQMMSWFFPNPVPVAEVLYAPLPDFAKHAGAVGHMKANLQVRNNARAMPLVVQYGNDYLPSFELMLMVRSMGLKAKSLHVDLGHAINLADNKIKTDDKLHIYPRFYRGKNELPAFEVYPVLDIYNKNIEQRELRNKIVIIGLTARQAATTIDTPLGMAMSEVMVAAHTVSSLLNEDAYVVPKWSDWIQRLAVLLVGLYLMFMLPRFRAGTGFALSVLVLIGLLNVQFITMIAESTWIPLMASMFALIIGHAVLSVKHSINHKMGLANIELSKAHLLLAQSFHAQGKLDQALEKYRECVMDESLLNQVYNLGQDYERKRQFNKAATAFRFIEDHDASFRDVQDRLVRNEEVATKVVLGAAAANPVNGTVVISTTGLEKPMLGRYQIDKELGRGAMGMVYLGHDPKIGRTVAIKTMMLAQEFEGDRLEEVKQRFFREAETAGRLNHPNIVTIYDVGEDQDLSYIAMDFIKGKNLLAYCKPETLLPVYKVVDLMIKVAEALDYAHEQNVVHRDIKPANLLYDKKTDILKVTDFGVACLTDASQTKTGTILGSPSYMSPEQLAGKKVDGRSDIFSLGISLYQLLTGELPFIGESLASLMYKIANEKHPDVRMFRPELPACISRIINKSLHKDIEQRYQRGDQVANALQRCKEKL